MRVDAHIVDCSSVLHRVEFNVHFNVHAVAEQTLWKGVRCIECASRFYNDISLTSVCKVMNHVVNSVVIVTVIIFL